MHGRLVLYLLWIEGKEYLEFGLGKQAQEPSLQRH